MKKFISLATLLFLTAFARAEAANPFSEVLTAAQKVIAASNYSWQITSINRDGHSFIETGSCQSDGNAITALVANHGQATNYAARCGRTVVKLKGAWLFPEEISALEKADLFPVRLGFMLAERLEPFSRPANNIEEFIKSCQGDITRIGDGIYLGEVPGDARLTTAGIQNVSFAAGGDKARLKIWVKNGMLKKCELHYTRAENSDEANARPEQVITVEFNDVGTTKVVIPPGAAKKLFG
jgi:hypothetical protein